MWNLGRVAVFLVSLMAAGDCGQTQGPAGSGQASATQTATPPGAGASYDEQKKFAVSLFDKQFYLEALPIFENLASRNPADNQVLLGLGGCLVMHAATIADQNAARAERIRAREILLRARQLGNNSPLLLNLLDTAPPDGSMRYPGSPEVVQEIAAGETAFAKNDYPEAITHYSKAAEMDPQNYGAALYLGDAYFALKNNAKASEWYEQAIAINPDRETAYRYESDMLTKGGDQQKARQLAIQAVIAEPYAQISWRGLAQWARANKLTLVAVRINTHSNVSDGNGKENLTITLDPKGNKNTLGVWLTYSGVRINWRKEDFKKHYPQETAYRHTLAEEVEALSTAASVLKDEKPEALSSDPDLAMLKKLSDAKMLEPYVLLNAADAGIAVDYVEYRAQNRAKLEEYLSTYVVPPAPASAAAK